MDGNSWVVFAIAAGGDIPALVEASKECTELKTSLLKELEELDTTQELDQTDYDELQWELRDHFKKSWHTILNRQVDQITQILRKLFKGDRLPLIPVTNETGSQYVFKWEGAFGRLVTGRAKALVSSTGFESVLLPWKG